MEGIALRINIPLHPVEENNIHLRHTLAGTNTHHLPIEQKSRSIPAINRINNSSGDEITPKPLSQTFTIEIIGKDVPYWHVIHIKTSQ